MHRKYVPLYQKMVMYMYIHHHLFSINYYDFIYKYFILHAAILYAHA